MKRSTVLIVVAIAASVCLASIGVSSAMATAPVLCKKSEEQCKYENVIPEGATIVAETTEASDKVKISMEGLTITCPSKLEATVGASSGSTRLLSISSWSLGNSKEGCTGIGQANDCGTAAGENLPYAAEAICPNTEELVTWGGPKWHLHCQSGGFTYIDCTYIGVGNPRFTTNHVALQYTKYLFKTTGSCLGTIETIVSGTFRFVNPKGPIYVAERGPEEAPQVVTGAANHITASGATLAGTVNPEGAPTKYWFEYGKTTAYGTKIPVSAEEVGTGFSPVAVSQTPTGLSNNTTYHFRVVAENPLGKNPVPGEDKTFYVGAPIYRSSFGSGEFGHPAGIAVDPSGNLWVADEEKNRVQHWSPSGELLGEMSIASQPTAVAVDSKGDVWVADKKHGRLVEFNPKPEFINVIGEGILSTPEAISLDPEGDLWVADAEAGVVQEFDTEGNLLQTLEGGEIGFYEPTGVAVSPSGNVYVADYGNSRVVEYSQSGELLTKWGPEVGGGNLLIQPTSLAVDSEGNVWVTAKYDNKVYEFTESGQYITKFSRAFKFARAGGIAVDSQFNVWVSDQGNHLVKEFSR